MKFGHCTGLARAQGQDWYRPREEANIRRIEAALEACDRKKHYPSREAAQHELKALSHKYRHRDTTLCVYKCPVCPGWCLGHSQA